MPAPRTDGVIACGLCLLCMLPFTSLVAADQFPEPAAPAGRHPAPPADSTPKLLVTTAGRIVEGHIRQTPGGYIVNRPNGQLLVPFEYVKFEATDLIDAYHKMRRTLPARTGTSHMALARWCITNELYDEAVAELKEALHLEPQRDEARTMLQRLEELRRPAGTQPDDSSKAPSHPAQEFERPETQSLASLSRESAQEFAVRIQPLLLNRCGNASCHGTAAENDFQLTNIHLARSNRVFAERNLAQTLKQIDFDHPDQSPLLTVPRGNHGRAGRSIFHGAGGSEQFDLLRSWIQQAVRDRTALGQTPATTAPKADSSPIATAVDAGSVSRPTSRPESPKSDTNATMPAVQASPIPPRGIPPTTNRRQQDDLNDDLQEFRPDPFDPREFNRQFGGRQQ